MWYGGLVAVALLVAAAGRSPWPLVTAVAIITGLFVYTFSAHVRANGRAVLLSVGGPVLGIGIVAGLVTLPADEAPIGDTALEAESVELPERPTDALDRVLERRRAAKAEPQAEVEQAPGQELAPEVGSTSLIERLRAQRRASTLPILPVELVEVFDVSAQDRLAVDGYQAIVGRVRNGSSQSLTRLVVHVQLWRRNTINRPSTLIDETDLEVFLRVPPGQTRSFVGQVVLRPGPYVNGQETLTGRTLSAFTIEDEETAR